MAQQGWKRLLAGVSAFRGPGQFPLAAYSEFMPPPRMGRKPYGAEDPVLFRDDDPLGWHVSEYEEVMELRPGLEHLGVQLVLRLEHLGNGRPAHGIARAKLEGNPYWPAELADRAGRLPHERYVVIAPLALSAHPGRQGAGAMDAVRRQRARTVAGLLEGVFHRAGSRDRGGGRFGVLSAAAGGLLRRIARSETRLAQGRLSRPAGSGKGDRSNLPERPSGCYAQIGPVPFSELDQALSAHRREAAARGALSVDVPAVRQFAGGRSPGVSGGRTAFAAVSGQPGVLGRAAVSVQLQRELPLAMQIPLLHMFPRHDHPYSLRVPQAGWMHEPGAEKGTGPICAQHPEGRSGKLDLSPFRSRTPKGCR